MPSVSSEGVLSPQDHVNIPLPSWVLPKKPRPDFPWIVVSRSMRTKTEVVPVSLFSYCPWKRRTLLQHPESYLSFFHCLLPSSPCWFSSFLKRSPLLLSWLVFHSSLSSILWSSPPHSRPSISFRSSIYLNLDSTDEVKKKNKNK